MRSIGAIGARLDASETQIAGSASNHVCRSADICSKSSDPFQFKLPLQSCDCSAELHVFRTRVMNPPYFAFAVRLIVCFTVCIVGDYVSGHVAAAEATNQGRPNIVLIMADDLGLGDVSHHVRTQMKKEPVIETPAIDSIARESLWFTDGHSATALCSPTRYCVMSGNNNYRSNAPWGVWGTFRETAFKKGDVTLGSVVKDAGYSTGFIGKWHLGGDFRDLSNGGIYRANDRNEDITGTVDLTKWIANGPRDWGFDYDFTLPCGIQGPIYTAYENNSWYPMRDDSEIVFLNKSNAIHPKDLTSKGEGMGDSGWDAREIGKLISSKAVDFIEANAGKDKPFFLYYCSPMCHVPHCPPAEFDGKKIEGATPSRHLDMILDLDQQVNRIIKTLKAKGVYDNTLIVFTSDNGGLAVDKATRASGHRVSGGYAGSKNSPLEGGHRTPFFAVWKDHIAPGVTDEPALNQDMLATFAALVGTKIPDGQALDSNNLLPLWTGEGQFKQRDFIVQQAGSGKEVYYRKGTWKLILQSNLQLSKFDPIALFNLADNPREAKQFNFVKSPEHRTRVEQMRKDYLEILNSRVRTTPRSADVVTPHANVIKPEGDTPVWTDAKTAAQEFAGFAFLGEYVRGDESIQVVPCEGQFYLSIYQGGLPGDGWDRGVIGHEWLDAEAIAERLQGYVKVDRSSKLEFTAPPRDAIVLFDGSEMEHWAFGKIKDELLQAGAKTKREFQDFQLHFECLIPLKPELPLAHPGRGNSGVFAVGAYEVQVCDTFGVDFSPERWKIDRVLKHPDTWCGGIYGIRAADTNMCLPPLTWQTFDVDFTAARFDGDKKVTDARMTVHQNGVLIHDDVTLPEGTGGGPRGPRAEVPRGPIYFQSHGNPVQYRNVWVVEK